MPWILAVVVALALSLTGCGSTEATDDGTGSSASGTGANADLDFTATTLEGAEFAGSSLAGKPAVLWFWAPWCPTCRAQSANISDLGEKYDGEVAVVGVGGLDSAAAITGLAEEIPNLTHLVDDAGEVWRHFRVTAQSTYTVIDADGEIVSDGYLDDAELNELVATLVDEG